MLRRIIVLLSILLTVSPAAFARYKIVINGDPNSKMPVAVPGFVTQKGGKAGGLAAKLADLVEKDFRISGQFAIIGEGSLPHADKDVNEIDFEKWKALEAQALVKGVVVDGKTVQIRLYDVSEKKMLIGKQYEIDGKSYIDAAHRFVDSALEALTGTRGPFESKIAASCGKPGGFNNYIYSFEMDGMRSGRISSGGGRNHISPAWSPDGSSVAFSAHVKDGSSEIFVSSGGGARQVTHFDSLTITPAWASSGSLIVASAKSRDTELYRVDLSGRVLNQVTRSFNIDFSPGMGPGSQMVFSSERAGGVHVFSSSTSGGGATRLTFVGRENSQADWSPDGTKIVFAGRDQGVFDVFVMDADGVNLQRLTRAQGSHESPTWSPDSRYIALATSGVGLEVMLDDGTNITPIPKSGSCINPDWGPWLSKE